MSNLTLEGISASLGKAHGPSNGWHKYEWSPCCNNHHPNNPAFSINWKTGNFKCHDCGENGKVTEKLLEDETFWNHSEESDLAYEKHDREFYEFNIVDQDSLTTKYLNTRGIVFETLELLEVPLREGRGDSNRVAVYPFFNKAGDVVSFQSTFLNLDCINLSDKTRRYKGKKSFGVGILRQKEKMIVCEGLETGLSVLQELGSEFGLIVCGDANGLVSLSNKNSWALKGAKKVLIAADNDRSNTGIKAARALINAIPTKTALYMPTLPGSDWNDVLLNGSFNEEWL